MAKAKNDMLQEKEGELKKRAKKEDDENLHDKVDHTQKVALQAIQKEINLEDLIKQEEAEREEIAEKKWMEKIEVEKKKSECMMKQIQERLLENQWNLKARQTEEEIKNIKKKAGNEISARRSNLKKQIMKMRKNAKRKETSYAQKLQDVRQTMATTMGHVYKKGDPKKCQTAISSDVEKANYCQAKYLDDYDGFNSCKDNDDFCNFCCENEFGELLMNERNSCLTGVCQTDPESRKPDGPDQPDTPAQPDKGPVGGKWMWQDEMLSKNN